MEIRRFQGEDDARGIRRVNALAWQEAYDDLLSNDLLAKRDPDPPDERVREFADRLRDDRGGIFVATADGAVRGYCYVRWGAETKSFVGDNEAEFKELYVEPDYWRAGFGTALLERGLDRLPSAVDRVRLETLEGNDIGHRFYAARGFDRTGSSAFEIGDELYPTAVYTLEL